MGVGVGVVGVGGARETCFENELKGDVAAACVCCGCMCVYGSVCVICRPVSASTRPSTFSAAQNWLFRLGWPGLLLEKLVF